MYFYYVFISFSNFLLFKILTKHERNDNLLVQNNKNTVFSELYMLKVLILMGVRPESCRGFSGGFTGFLLETAEPSRVAEFSERSFGQMC